MLKKSTLLFFLTLFSIIGKAQNGISIYDSILSGGIQRKFRLYVPNSYSPGTAAPLVFNLHGYTSNSAQQVPYANFMPIADTAKFLVVSPDGTFANGAQYWNAGFGGPVNDVQFISDLIDSIDLAYNIDLEAVYSCGMSNGGIMSYYLACNLPTRITAIASVTGSMLNSWFSCTPSFPRPFPVMEIHGTNDATVPYNGNSTFPHIDSVIKKWRVYNNCNSAPVITAVTNTNTSDNSTATNYKYTGGNSGSSVELYKVTGGSHSWPGAIPVISNTNQDFSASVEIWRFFRQYKLGMFIANVGMQENIFAETLNVFPNPSAETISIRTKNGSAVDRVIVSDISGKIVKEQKGVILNVTDLTNGIYFVKAFSGTVVLNARFIKN